MAPLLGSLDQITGPPQGLRAFRPRFCKQVSQLTYGELAQELVLEHWEQKGEQQGRDDLGSLKKTLEPLESLPLRCFRFAGTCSRHKQGN